jgi:hypothetical protein
MLGDSTVLLSPRCADAARQAQPSPRRRSTTAFSVAHAFSTCGNGRLPSVDLPRMQVPLGPPPVPVPDIDELEDVLVKHVQQRYVDPTGEIQRLLRLLTHRQMRELCQKLANGKDPIAATRPRRSQCQLSPLLSLCRQQLRQPRNVDGDPPVS